MFRKSNSNNNSISQEATHSSDSCNNDRPRIQIKPRGIGPITSLHQNDVLCGRGGRINGHAGNIQFRNICGEKRDEYFAKDVKKIQKAHIAASVVECIRAMSPPGRFLKQDTKSGHWYDIGCAKAMTKVGQAIREYTVKEEDESSSQQFDGILEKAGASFSNDNLYPGYNPNEIAGIDQPQQHGVVPGTPVYQQPTESVFQHSIANYYATNMDDSQMLGSAPRDDHHITVPPFTSDDRNMRSSCGFSSLLRESILSDMSDCDSVMGWEDDMNMANRCPSVGEGSLLVQAGLMDAGLRTAPLATSAGGVSMNTTQETAEMALVTEDGNVQPANKRRRQGEFRRSSIMSTTSTVSLLSLCSIATWGAF